MNSKGKKERYTSDYSNLKRLDDLLEPDWDEDSSVTVNINPHIPLHTPTPSQFERLKEMKTSSKVGIGGAIVAVVAALVKLAQELGWILQ